jgi:hypothetical protein
VIITGIATKPAEVRTLKSKDTPPRNLTVWEMPVLDDDTNAVITIQAWQDENPWPKATRGTQVTAHITRYDNSAKYGARGTLAPAKPTG